MQVAGFDITTEMLLIIGGAILLLAVIIVAVIIFLKRRKKNAKAAPAPSQAGPEEKYRQAIIENEKEKIRQQLAEATQKPAQQAQPKPQPVQPQTQAQPSGQTQPLQPAQQPIQPAKSGEDAQIERLAALLKPKSREYTSKEIRDTIIEGGYPEAVADEVIRRLGI
ncbi:MAG: hypothetical protein V1493_01750 [Candidatus Diapherotrites archaeon]